MADRIAPDDRVFLKIKLKSLAAESRIIRTEERKRPGPARWPLTQHRRGIVRRESRKTLLAYGYLRGRTREQIEVRPRTHPDWSDISRMVKRYGPRTFDETQFKTWAGLD
jgi:hypothetical protein